MCEVRVWRRVTIKFRKSFAFEVNRFDGHAQRFFAAPFDSLFPLGALQTTRVLVGESTQPLRQVLLAHVIEIESMMAYLPRLAIGLLQLFDRSSHC